MTKRKLYIFLCVAALGVGALIYILLRPDTHVSAFARNMLPILETYSEQLRTFNFPFIKYYLPDLLWAFSLLCGLNAIFDDYKRVFINSAVVVVIGIVWEALQFFGVVSGTGDITDIFMYMAGALLILITEIIFKRCKNEKT